MRRFPIFVMALLLGSSAPEPHRARSPMRETPPLPRPPKRRPKVLPPHPMDFTCPRCKAVPGEPCNARTLGRHLYHRARVDAADVDDAD